MRWKRKLVSRGSSVEAEIRWPNCDMKSWPAPFMGPIVSKANGKKRYVLEISAYFSSFLKAAASTAEAAFADVRVTYEAATVSVTVTSQVAQRPSRHGTMVMPSGRFPSVRVNPRGSLTEGMPALDIARQLMSLRK